MAVTLRSIVFFLLVVALVSDTAWGNTNANTLEDEEEFFSTGKEVSVDDIPEGNAAPKSEVGGRKMIQKKVIIKRVEIKGSGTIHGEEGKVSSTKNQVMAVKSGKIKRNKVAIANANNMNGGGSTSKRNKEMNKEAADHGFVAFNADYHAPRHHPPKNN